jgi:hypothetical protein
MVEQPSIFIVIGIKKQTLKSVLSPLARLGKEDNSSE